MIPLELLSTNCDIYRGHPKILPAVAEDVPCQLVAAFGSVADQTARNNLFTGKPWTHYLIVQPDVDIRDGYQGSETGWVYANSDTVVIPSGGTDYVVVFVEVRGRGTVGEHKRVYLDRQLPGWPAV